jgi:hypothetical protein
MYKQLQNHLLKHIILAEEQFGWFKDDSSTSKAIFKLINDSL